jgi:cell wall-associated NlpC family hydrolase
MSCRRLIGSLVAFAVLGGASLVVAPTAFSPVFSFEDVRVVQSPEGRLLALAGPDEGLESFSPGELAAFLAVERVGVPYRYGGESPESGFDCSGLIRWSYARVGVDVPHNSRALYGVGEKVRRAALEPGDVLFFRGLGHVGMYLGNGRMVHAPQTGKHVEIVELAETNYGQRLIGARRVTAT